jgi:glycosyltransferase involved in cell wall biosynthesis
MVRLLVEGWIHYPHSYSLVNIFQLLNLDRDIIKELYFKELPPYNSAWKKVNLVEKGILTHDQYDKIASIKPWNGQEIDVVYRIGTPLFLNVENDAPVVLFYTAEFQSMKHLLYEGGTLDSLCDKVKEGKMILTTPSQWSAQAPLQKGIEPFIIPHGIDSSSLYPDKKGADVLKENLGIPKDAKTLLSVGAMTGNKNIIDVLRTMYKLSLTRDDVYLVLKGTDELYGSRQFVNDAVRVLMKEDAISSLQWRKICESGRFIYIEETLSKDEMRSLYSLADIYMAPYLAEGFCMPVLEAMACGAPCIVTQGGPTDDFIDKRSCVACPSVSLKNDNGQIMVRPIPLSLHNYVLEMLDDKEIKQKAIIVADDVRISHDWKCIGSLLSSFLSAVVMHTSHPSHPLSAPRFLKRQA